MCELGVLSSPALFLGIERDGYDYDYNVCDYSGKLRASDPTLYEGINYRQLADEFLDATVNKFGVDNGKALEVLLKAFGVPRVRYLSREVSTYDGKTEHGYDNSSCVYPSYYNSEKVTSHALDRLQGELQGHNLQNIIEDEMCLHRNRALWSIGAYVPPVGGLPFPNCDDLEWLNPFPAIPYTQCMKILEPEFGGNSKTNPATPGDWNKWMAARTVCLNFFK